MEIEEGPTSKETRVWLTSEEIKKVTEYYPPAETKWIALNLIGRGGLKVEESIGIKRSNVIVEPPQPCIQLAGSGLRRNLRQCPIPESLAYAILGKGKGKVVDVRTRSVRRWVSQVGEELAEDEPEKHWREIKPSDLRRSWIDNLLSDDVPPGIVMQWSGLGDMESFQDIYLSRQKISSSLEMASQSDIFD